MKGNLLLLSFLLCTGCGSESKNPATSAITNATSDAPEAVAKEDPGEALASIAAEHLVGRQAPKLRLQTIDGKTINLADLYGKKAVYLKFWATWCVPCRQQMPHFERMARGASDDLAVIAINTGFNETIPLIQEYRRKHGLTMPIAVDEDGRLARAFDLRVTPQHIVIGRDGRIAFVGHLADARVEEAIARARRGEPSPTRNASGSSQPLDGPQAVDADLRAVNGRSITLRPVAGRNRYLLFFSPWCESYWKTSRPEAARACRTAREISAARQDDDSWVGIASRLWVNAGDVTAFAKEHQVRMPLVLDSSGELFRAFNVNAIPTVLVIDSSGRVVRRISGSSSHFAAELQALENRS